VSGDGKALLLSVRQLLWDEYGPFWQREGGLPEGLRLELSPQAANRLLTDSSLGWGYQASDPRPPSDQASEKFGLPVKIIGLDLEPGAWRLVIVTEKVLAGGRFAD
jgi:hypothetical protein